MRLFSTILHVVFLVLLCVVTFRPCIDASLGFEPNCTQHFYDGFLPSQYKNSTPLCREGYFAISYDNVMFNPCWTAYHVTRKNVKDYISGRMSSFYLDPDLQAAGVAQSAYRHDVWGTDWNRGHLAPNKILSYTTQAKKETFRTSNIAPQWGQFNQQSWRLLEDDVFNWLLDKAPAGPSIIGPDGNETSLFILTGVAYTNRSNVTRFRGNGTKAFPPVAYPDFYFKILCDPVANESVGFIGKNEVNGGNMVDIYRSVAEVEATLFSSQQEVHSSDVKEESAYPFQLLSEGCNPKKPVNASHWNFKDFVTSSYVLPTTTTASPGVDPCDATYLNPTDPSPSSQLSIDEINGILQAHNDARRNVTPSARVMPMLKWNQKLADYAYEYMNTCVGMVHSSQSARSNKTRFGFNYIGENLAAGSGSNYLPTNGGGVTSTGKWNSELQYWTYPTACSGVCGHYTQNIWATTTDVGCGYARCDSLTYKNYWSCVYGPGGNYAGQAPYQQSTSTELATCQTGNTLAPVTSSAPTATSSASAAATTVALATTLAATTTSILTSTFMPTTPFETPAATSSTPAITPSESETPVSTTEATQSAAASTTQDPTSMSPSTTTTDAPSGLDGGSALNSGSADDDGPNIGGIFGSVFLLALIIFPLRIWLHRRRKGGEEGAEVEGIPMSEEGLVVPTDSNTKDFFKASAESEGQFATKGQSPKGREREYSMSLL